MFAPVDDSAIHILKALLGAEVQDVEAKEDKIEFSFNNGAKLIIYDGEFEDE